MGKSKEKETICWDCQNYSRCSWNDGKPVKGWKATPAIIKDSGGDIHSYLVEDCPHFKRDKKSYATMDDISKIIGLSKQTIYREIRILGTGLLKHRLKEKGYKLYICEGNGSNEHFLERL